MGGTVAVAMVTINGIVPYYGMCPTICSSLIEISGISQEL